MFGLRFFSLLCRTDPWIRIKSPRNLPKGRISSCAANITWIRLPGSQHSSTYSPFDGVSPAGTGNCSKPVPPVGRRMKRFVSGVFKCDPGRNERAPFSEVHCSRGIQNPRADGGSVYYLRGSGRHGRSRYKMRTALGTSYMRVSVTDDILLGYFCSRVVVFRNCRSYASFPIGK